jgi:hypothetical protein
MNEANDRLEWELIEVVMRRMGFSSRWVNLIMTCVRIVSYDVVVNGQPVGKIVPTRGIRQGDPISPYLFLICAEALSSLLQHVERTGSITGVPTSNRGPCLSHLFFANDSLLLCKANSVEWQHIMRLLEKYECVSGLKLNMDKTSLFFSRNT